MVVLVLLLCFTICIFISHFLPQFRRSDYSTGNLYMDSVVTYWYSQNKLYTENQTVMTKSRLYARDFLCGEQSRLFIATSSFAVVATVFGILAVIFTALLMMSFCHWAMEVIVLVLTLLAGVWCVPAFGMLTWGFCHDFCSNNMLKIVRAYRDNGFQLVEGYVLLCVAGLGYFVVALIEVVAFCIVGHSGGGASAAPK
jgi:hypothetical protein